MKISSLPGTGNRARPYPAVMVSTSVKAIVRNAVPKLFQRYVGRPAWYDHSRA